MTSVYALGEGWTGALGTGRVDQTIAGHADHDDSPERRSAADAPVCMYTGRRVLSCAVGWGHSALVVQTEESEEEKETTNFQNDGSTLMLEPTTPQTKLLVTGRPHEFLTLLRLRRQPYWLRKYASEILYRTSHELSGNSWHPVDLIGRTIQYMSEMFLKDTHNWDQMREQSFLTSPTEILIPAKVKKKKASNNTTPNAPPVAVSCGAGVTAVTCADGLVYTFGLNGMGQCGVGEESNNVWTPTAVTGLSSEFAMADRALLAPSHPVRQTVMGLQRT